MLDPIKSKDYSTLENTELPLSTEGHCILCRQRWPRSFTTAEVSAEIRTRPQFCPKCRLEGLF